MPISDSAYNDLVNELNTHAHQYYVFDQPLISDAEYDQKYQQLLEYEEANPLLTDPGSPTQRVGDKLSEQFEPFTHSSVMASLGNAFDKDSLEKFCERVQKGLQSDSFPEFCIEPKIDGAAVALHYDNGYFKVGATRGNGKTGETITHNLKTIRSLPLSIPHKEALEVRGEVYIKDSVFKNLEGSFSNSRNTASGALRQLDPAIAAERKLDIFIYQGIQSQGIHTHYDDIQRLKALGLPTVDSVSVCKNFEDLWQALQHIEKNRETYDYQIDGAVIKVNRYDEQQRLGYTSKAPRWAIAYKFAAEQAITTLKDISVQVGRTGILTPVGELDPTEVGGAIVSRATLHNMSEIERKGINIGDKVVIQRAGDVIPEIISVHKANEHSSVFKMPSECPECNSDVLHIEGEIGHWCTNSDCPAQIRGRMNHFVSKKALDIDGLGEQLINQLVDKGLLKTVTDIYLLTLDQLLSCERMGLKSANNVLKAIADKRQLLWSNFLFACGIPFVGEVSAELITKEFQDPIALMTATVEELTAINGIGDKTAESLVHAIEKGRLKHIIEDAIELGITFEAAKQSAQNTWFSGKSFLITGTLETLGRTEAQNKIKALGGSLLSSVSKNLSVLIVGQKAGSKLKKAEQLNNQGEQILILNEDEFLEKLSEINPHQPE